MEHSVSPTPVLESLLSTQAVGAQEFAALISFQPRAISRSVRNSEVEKRVQFRSNVFRILWTTFMTVSHEICLGLTKALARQYSHSRFFPTDFSTWDFVSSVESKSRLPCEFYFRQIRSRVLFNQLYLRLTFTCGVIDQQDHSRKNTGKPFPNWDLHFHLTTHPIT
jgi:hypothetical protein